MKKIFSFLAVVMFAITLASCGGGNSPEGAVKNALNAVKSGNLKSIYEYACKSDGEPCDIDDLSPNDIQQKEATLKAFDDISFKIGETTMDEEDENKATVEVTVEWAGIEHKDDMRCVKGDDGKWRVRKADLPI